MTLAEFAQLQWHFVIARQYVIQSPFFFSIIAAHASHPFLYFESGNYFLLYQKYAPFHFIAPWSRMEKWNLHIEMCHSSNLIKWSPPRILLKSTFDWHQN